MQHERRQNRDAVGRRAAGGVGRTKMMRPPALALLADCAEELQSRCAKSGRMQMIQAARMFSSNAMKVVEQASSPIATTVRVKHSDQGLFTNLIGLMEACCLAEALEGNAPVIVDWRRGGDESHFVYGAVTTDLFSVLFEPTPAITNAAAESTPLPEPAAVVDAHCVNPYFYSVVRGLFWESRHLASLRRAFAAAAGPAVLRPSAAVRDEVDATLAAARRAGPRGVLGVHKRVATPGVAAIQLTMRVPRTHGQRPKLL